MPDEEDGEYCQADDANASYDSADDRSQRDGFFGCDPGFCIARC
jgi:hypothetical protein